MAKSKITRESLLAAHAKPQPVTVEGYPTVYIKTLKKAEITLAYSQGEAKAKELNVPSDELSGSYLLAASMIDLEGNRLFEEGHESEIPQLDYPFFRAVNNKFSDIHYPEPTIQQIATDAKN